MPRNASTWQAKLLIERALEWADDATSSAATTSGVSTIGAVPPLIPKGSEKTTSMKSPRNSAVDLNVNGAPNANGVALAENSLVMASNVAVIIPIVLDLVKDAVLRYEKLEKYTWDSMLFNKDVSAASICNAISADPIAGANNRSRSELARRIVEEKIESVFSYQQQFPIPKEAKSGNDTETDGGNNPL